ncbi:ABCC2 (predicted) [Pycnogonum litorale]
MLAPYEVWQQTRSTTPSIRWNFLNGTKLVVDFILVVLSLALFISNTLTQSLNGGNIVLHTIGQGILTITYIIVAILIVRGRKRGMHTSGTLFVFWILQTISGLLIYRSIFLHVLDGTTIVDVVRVLINMTSFPLIVVELLLSCLADSTPEHKLSDKRLCPEESSSMLSQIIFWWINPLIIKGYRRPLTIDDQWTLTSKHRCESLVERFQRSWQSELSKNKRSCLRKGVYRPSVFMTIIKTFWPSFLAGFIFKLSADLLQFVGPQILSLLISFVSSNEPTWKGLLYVAILFSTSILHSILENRYFFYMYVVAMETRSAVAAAVYSKSLKLSNKERRSSTVGEIVNLMSIDTQVLLDLIPFVNVIWSSPLQIILSMYFLWQVLGPSVLTGIGLMVLLLPLNGVIANFAHRYQVDNMKHKDNRTKSMSEILNGIKVLKLYAWELPFIDTVLGIRSLEVKLLKKIGYVTAVSEMLWNGATFLVAIGSFATFIFVDKSNVLTPNVAFVSLSLFNIIRFPLMMFPTLMTEIIQTLVSIRRLNKFMRSEELDRNSIDRQPSQDCAIRIRDGCFSWGDEDETEVLRDINVDLKTGSLVAVVGQVGSGKSSLVSAIIGELEKKSGYVGIKGSLSYVPQTAWIRNDTIKGNVVMQKPFDDKTYTDVIQSCALSTDLDILPGGDRTEIGEKGINLSGGQKQRISLARAAYHQTDIYLLDDPLSAVDSNVGKHIFEQVIGPKGLLRYKTRVLVTHGISYLPECDSVIVLKEGRISEVGTYQYLLSKNGAFADFLTQYANESSTNVEQENFESNESVTKEHIQHGVKRQQSYDKRSEQMSERETLRRFTSGTELLSHHDEDNLIHKAKLIEIEEASTGQVPWFVYLSYIKTVGCSTFVGIIFCWIVAEGFYTASNVWLSAWSMDPSPINGTIDTELRDLRLGIYGVFGVAQAIFLLLGAFGIAYFTIQSSAILHARMLNSIMKSPMSFFDTTPMGRIINRFAKDINVMDVNLINNIRDFLLCLFSVLATTVVISIESPIFLAVMVPLLFVYFFVQRVYIASSRQLRRLESITRSPIYVHFSESLMGASSIRAYQFQEDFIDENNQKLDENQICYFPAVSVNRQV